MRRCLLERLHTPISLRELITVGLIEFDPLTYEDFLPMSAAGIFTSNLENKHSYKAIKESPRGQRDFEKALGCEIAQEFDLYDNVQRQSIDQCAKELGIHRILIE
jgi:uncharacterized glyoxalase superfamily metalloenzyme YdcJ